MQIECAPTRQSRFEQLFKLSVNLANFLSIENGSASSSAYTNIPRVMVGFDEHIPKWLNFRVDTDLCTWPGSSHFRAPQSLRRGIAFFRPRPGHSSWPLSWRIPRGWHILWLSLKRERKTMKKINVYRPAELGEGYNFRFPAVGCTPQGGGEGGLQAKKSTLLNRN